MKQQNEFLGLLEHDYIQVKNPFTNQLTKLYRVIALKTFRIDPLDIEKGIGPYNNDVLDRYYRELKNKHDCYKKESESILKLHTEAKYKLEDLLAERNISDGKITELWTKEKQKMLDEQTVYFNSIESNLVKINIKIDKIKGEMVDFLNSKKTWPFFGILKDTIGGYVENLDVFGNQPSWVGNNAIVYGDCYIENSYIIDSAIICGKNDKYNSRKCVIKNSLLKNFSKITGSPYVINTILRDAAEIKDSVNVENCLLLNSTTIFEHSTVIGSVLTVGSYCKGNSKVTDSILLHTSGCETGSDVNTTILEGSVLVKNRTLNNENLKADLNLRSIVYEGN